jgi:hypothetical protein
MEDSSDDNVVVQKGSCENVVLVNTESVCIDL